MIDAETLRAELNGISSQKESLRNAMHQAIGAEQAYLSILSRMEAQEAEKADNEVSDEGDTAPERSSSEPEWPEACDIP